MSALTVELDYRPRTRDYTFPSRSRPEDPRAPTNRTTFQLLPLRTESPLKCSIIRSSADAIRATFAAPDRQFLPKTSIFTECFPRVISLAAKSAVPRITSLGRMPALFNCFASCALPRKTFRLIESYKPDTAIQKPILRSADSRSFIYGDLFL